MIVVVGLRLGYLIARRVVDGLVLLSRSQASKDAEILLLRHQLAAATSAGWRRSGVRRQLELDRRIGRPYAARTANSNRS